jgi:hypothetical protein
VRTSTTTNPSITVKIDVCSLFYLLYKNTANTTARFMFLLSGTTTDSSITVEIDVCSLFYLIQYGGIATVTTVTP